MELLTPEQAAERLRICTKVLRRLRQQGKIRYVAVTQRKIFYRPEDCDAFIESRVRQETHNPPLAPQGKRRAVTRGYGDITQFSVSRKAEGR